ncbi:MAG: DNA polymerase III subunit beta [Parcubacteria group bacterium CG10_big_fil_rev_8_21_14_0_10_41_35]|nr:MAG: DNA polymerase III subunit beta [Parcubacteria group bacterium CG22_combo_CG10-13_8_21_14_all_41_9]PIR57461.1 MAG: DNA polymerase III subunit beta [Parcubacteria group bacterium CG10_big_fil_rev_8_21_14_0_10_41_35]
MKLSCTQENLARALAQVCPVATKGGTLPILSNILLEAKEGALRISATNLEIGISAIVRGKIIEEGTFTVNGRLFFDYVNLLSSDTVSLELEADHLRARSGRSQTKIHGLASEEFPVIPSMEAKNRYALPVADFSGALSQVLFSVAYSDARPELSGVLMKFDEKILTLAGTDSYRLAERKIELKQAASQSHQIIVPLRTVQELARVLGHEEGEIAISANENQVLFSFGEVELTSRVISGTFPDYKEIIPKNSTTQVVLDKDPLVRAIKSASLFCRQGLNHVSFQFSQDKILVSSSSSQVGENMVEVPAKIEGKDVDIVFDYRYVLDGLHAIAGSEVSIELEGASAPGVFLPKEKDSYLYLVMPIKQ